MFDTKRKIDNPNDLYNQFSVSSKADVQKVINYFSDLHPLIGLKYNSYLKWIDSLRNSSRYRNLNFPVSQ